MLLAYLLNSKAEKSLKKSGYRYVEYGTYHLPKGTRSDDSSMTLCLADSIGTVKKIDYEDIMNRFWEWYKCSKYKIPISLYYLFIKKMK